MLKLAVDEAMREQGVRAETLALSTGIALGTITAYRRNRRHRVDLRKLEQIAEVLNVPALSLIREVEDEDNDNQHDQGTDQGY